MRPSPLFGVDFISAPPCSSSHNIDFMSTDIEKKTPADGTAGSQRETWKTHQVSSLEKEEEEEGEGRGGGRGGGGGGRG